MRTIVISMNIRWNSDVLVYLNEPMIYVSLVHGS